MVYCFSFKKIKHKSLFLVGLLFLFPNEKVFSSDKHSAQKIDQMRRMCANGDKDAKIGGKTCKEWMSMYHFNDCYHGGKGECGDEDNVGQTANPTDEKDNPDDEDQAQQPNYSPSCQAAHAKAFRNCENAFNKDGSGFSNEKIMNLAAQATSVASVVKSAISNGNISKACKMNKTLQGILGAASFGYARLCGHARAQCLQVCSGEDNSSARIECSRFQEKIDMADLQVADSVMTGLGANACADDAAFKPQNAIAKNPDFCVNNPNSQVCVDAKQQCSDPSYARLHPECVCSDAEQQRTNPICNPNSGGDSGGGLISGSDGNGGDLLGASALADFFPDEDAVNNKPGGSQGALGGSGGNFGGGGGGLGGGGAEGGNLAGEGGGHGEGPYETDVIQGTSNSKGSGYGSYSGNFANNGPRRGARNGYGKGKNGQADGKFDLSKYLPKNRKKQRALAGMSIKAKDGITGPMGPSIWEKVSRRYKRVQPYLKP